MTTQTWLIIALILVLIVAVILGVAVWALLRTLDLVGKTFLEFWVGGNFGKRKD